MKFADRPYTVRRTAMRKMSAKPWFVTYAPIDPRVLTAANGHRRMSKRFATEAEAKAFAASRLKDATYVTAGTLNPVVPKRFIGSAGIMDWLNESD